MYTGSCHCRSVRYKFIPACLPADVPLVVSREPFLRKHGAILTEDPGARLEMRADIRSLLRYRFGPKVLEFFTCMHCGVFVSVVATTGGKMYASLNVHTLDERPAFSAKPGLAPLDSEKADEVLARAATQWSALALDM